MNGNARLATWLLALLAPAVALVIAVHTAAGTYERVKTRPEKRTLVVTGSATQRIVSDLMKFGEVQRGSIGYLRVERLTDRLAAEVGALSTQGAVVSRMMRDSESYEAGLRPGDVIVAFNGQPVEDPSQFFRLVADAKVGSTASVAVTRNGRQMEFKLPIVSSAQTPTRIRR